MDQTLHNSLEFAGITDTGCSRTKNEDCITWDAQLGLAILADGMGGANAGEVAGQITAETVLKEVRESIENQPYGLGVVDEGNTHNRASLVLRNSLLKANSVVLRIAHDQPECSGMGTTALIVLFYDNSLSAGHVGDSRLYQLRNGQLTQLTEDHTVLQEVLNTGIYSVEAAEETVSKNIVTRAVGVAADLNVDIVKLATVPGDLYLMCSDGLSDLVSDDEIQTTLMTGERLNDLAKNLVDLAIKKGGNDNISVILIKVLKSFQSKRSFRQRIVDRFF